MQAVLSSALLVAYYMDSPLGSMLKKQEKKNSIHASKIKILLDLD